jgi:hypothetical protein
VILVYLGCDDETKKRKYYNRTIHESYAGSTSISDDGDSLCGAPILRFFRLPSGRTRNNWWTSLDEYRTIKAQEASMTPHGSKKQHDRCNLPEILGSGKINL